KEALLWWTLAHHQLGRLTVDMLGATKAAYMSLVDFVDKPTGRSAIDRYRSSNTDEMDGAELAALGREMASEVLEGVGSPQAIAESVVLSEEFDLRWEALQEAALGHKGPSSPTGEGDRVGLLQRLTRFVRR